MTDGYVIGRRSAGLSRATAFGLVVAVYLAAGGAAWAVAALAPHRWHPIWTTLAADVVATLVVFAASMVWRNASLYDPYWSVAPPIVAFAWLHWAGGGVGARQALVLALIVIWAVRLTGNWSVGWRGMAQEDWRYVQLREERGRVPWWLINLGGIQLMPTLVVFAGLLPVWRVMTVGGRPFGALDVVAAVVTATAIGIEATADRQLRRFAADPAHHGLIAEVGLWRYVRHPNYLGEIGFWWGLWLFGLAAAPAWWAGIGALAMVVLFVFASVPLMDRRSLARRPGYAEHMARVPALLPRLRTRRVRPAG